MSFGRKKEKFCELGKICLGYCGFPLTGALAAIEKPFVVSFHGNVCVCVCVSRSSASYRLKHRVMLEDIWVYSFDDDDDDEDDEEAGGDVDLRVTLVLAWAPTYCIVSFW